MSATFVIDHHVAAGLAIFGLLLDLLGGLYLAYDLLGGPRGPLRLLTEVITYVVIAVVVGVVGYTSVYLVVTTLKFKIVAVLGSSLTLAGALGLGMGGGLGTGLAFASNVHYRRIRRKSSSTLPWWLRIALGLIVGLETGFFGHLGFLGVIDGSHYISDLKVAFAGAFLFGSADGLVFGSLVAWLLVHTSKDISVAAMPNIDRFGYIVGMVTGLIIGVTVGADYSALFAASPIMSIVVGGFGGIIAGIGLGLVIATDLRVRWWILKLPRNRLGVLGVFLFLGGWIIQLLLYLVTLFDIPVH